MLNDYFALARTAEANKDFELAIRYYQEDLATQPYSGRSIFGLVICYILRKQWLKATEELSKIMLLNPQDKTAHEVQLLINEKKDNFILINPNFLLIYHPSTCQDKVESLIKIVDKFWPLVLDYFKMKALLKILIEVDPAYGPIARIETFQRPLIPKIYLNEERICEDILIHEMTHILKFNYNRFLTEGLAVAAQYKLTNLISWPFEDSDFKQKLAEHKEALVPLEVLALETNENLNYYSPANLNFRSSKLAYLESGSFVDFLISTYGMEKVDALFVLLDNPRLGKREIADCFAEIFALNITGLEKLWLESIGLAKKYELDREPEQLRQQATELLIKGERNYDFSVLLEGRDLFLRLIREEIANAKDYYYLARVYFSLANTPEAEAQRDQQLVFIEQAISQAQKAVDLEKNDSDSHRILGESYGKLIQYKGPISGIKYGPVAEKELKKAYALDPLNLFALLGLGRMKLFTPPLFGGSIKEARKLFEQVIKQAPEFSSGYTWLGISYREENSALAKTYLTQALAINPLDRLAGKTMEELS